MTFLGGILTAAALLLPDYSVAQAQGPAVSAAHKPIVGDGDPFPLQCVDFSGLWTADNGTRYTINQTGCQRIHILMLWKNYGEDSISIVPDNINRAIPGRERSAVRHRWNSLRHGSIIESHLSYIQGRTRVSEVVMYERASAGLLLETTYSTTEHLDRPGMIERDYEQQVFRRTGVARESFPRKRAH